MLSFRWGCFVFFSLYIALCSAELLVSKERKVARAIWPRDRAAQLRAFLGVRNDMEVMERRRDRKRRGASEAGFIVHPREIDPPDRVERGIKNSAINTHARIVTNIIYCSSTFICCYTLHSNVPPSASSRAETR